MDVKFRDSDLETIERDATFTAGLDVALVKAFRKRMQGIRAATDERDLYTFKSWRFEKLKGDRTHQRSMRLNDQWRLIVEIIPGIPSNTMVIVAIEDYH